MSVIDLPLRRAMDEHLGSWSIAWAEVTLNKLASLDRRMEPPDRIPEFPLIEIDFSLLVPKSQSYGQVVEHLSSFQHPLLKRIRYVDCFEGKAIGPDHRSLTFRTVIGDDSRTLRDEDSSSFRRDFESHLANHNYELRR